MLMLMLQEYVVRSSCLCFCVLFGWFIPGPYAGVSACVYWNDFSNDIGHVSYFSWKKVQLHGKHDICEDFTEEKVVQILILGEISLKCV